MQIFVKTLTGELPLSPLSCRLLVYRIKRGPSRDSPDIVHPYLSPLSELPNYFGAIYPTVLSDVRLPTLLYRDDGSDMVILTPIK